MASALSLVVVAAAAVIVIIAVVPLFGERAARGASLAPSGAALYIVDNANTAGTSGVGLRLVLRDARESAEYVRLTPPTTSPTGLSQMRVHCPLGVCTGAAGVDTYRQRAHFIASPVDAALDFRLVFADFGESERPFGDSKRVNWRQICTLPAGAAAGAPPSGAPLLAIASGVSDTPVVLYGTVVTDAGAAAVTGTLYVATPGRDRTSPCKLTALLDKDAPPLRTLKQHGDSRANAMGIGPSIVSSLGGAVSWLDDTTSDPNKVCVTTVDIVRRVRSDGACALGGWNAGDTQRAWLLRADKRSGTLFAAAVHDTQDGTRPVQTLSFEVFQQVRAKFEQVNDVVIHEQPKSVPLNAAGIAIVTRPSPRVESPARAPQYDYHVAIGFESYGPLLLGTGQHRAPVPSSSNGYADFSPYLACAHASDCMPPLRTSQSVIGLGLVAPRWPAADTLPPTWAPSAAPTAEPAAESAAAAEPAAVPAGGGGAPGGADGGAAAPGGGGGAPGGGAPGGGGAGGDVPDGGGGGGVGGSAPAAHAPSSAVAAPSGSDGTGNGGGGANPIAAALGLAEPAAFGVLGGAAALLCIVCAACVVGALLLVRRRRARRAESDSTSDDGIVVTAVTASGGGGGGGGGGSALAEVGTVRGSSSYDAPPSGLKRKPADAAPPAAAAPALATSVYDSPSQALAAGGGGGNDYDAASTPLSDTASTTYGAPPSEAGSSEYAAPPRSALVGANGTAAATAERIYDAPPQQPAVV